jgi:hypothetical protein
MKHLFEYEEFQLDDMDQELYDAYIKTMMNKISFPELRERDYQSWIDVIFQTDPKLVDLGPEDISLEEYESYYKRYKSILNTPTHFINIFIADLLDENRNEDDEANDKPIRWWKEAVKGVDVDDIYMMKSLWDEKLILPMEFIQVK